MPCDEWSRLLERYRGAVNAYSEAAKVLGDRPGTAFSETWQRAERARTKCTRGRADLLHHEHVHACLEPDGGKQPSTGMNHRAFVVGHGQASG
jgi:hypothetical protein